MDDMTHDQLEQLREVLRSIHGTTDDEHPDPDRELIAYVDGTLDAATREIIETHLEDCDTCSAEVRDLRAAAAELKPRRNWIWLAVAAALAVLIAIAVLMNTRRENRSQSPPVISVTTPVVEQPAYESAQWEALVSEALKTARLPYPKDLRALRGPNDRIRGSNAGTPARLDPAGIVIDETRPRFNWPSAGETAVVSVFDGDRVIAQSEPLRGKEWTPPRDLPRARTLLWQVELRDGDVRILPEPPAPQAMFRIASQRDHDDLARAKRDHPDDPLLLAVLYARAGLRAQALHELREIDVAKIPEAKRLVAHSTGRGDPTSTAADQ